MRVALEGASIDRRSGRGAAVGSLRASAPTPTLLSPAQRYEVAISTDSVKDLAGNPWIGVDASEWRFTTEPDTTPPALWATDPSADAEARPASASRRATLFFDEQVALLRDGSAEVHLLAIREGSPDELVRVLRVADPRHVRSHGDVVTLHWCWGLEATALEIPDSLESDYFMYVADDDSYGGDDAQAGSEAGATPCLPLQDDTEYELRIPSGAIADVGLNVFAGADVRFRTAYETAPALLLTHCTPKNGAAGVPSDQSLVRLVFSEDVAVGVGTLRLFHVSRGDVVANISAADLGIVGAVVALALPPGALMWPHSEYQLRMDPGFVTDLSGNEFAGGQLSFTTALDLTPPSILSYAPAGTGIRQVDAGTVLLTFDEPVQVGLGGILMVTSSGAAVDLLNVATSPRVVVSGSSVMVVLRFTPLPATRCVRLRPAAESFPPPLPTDPPCRQLLGVAATWIVRRLWWKSLRWDKLDLRDLRWLGAHDRIHPRSNRDRRHLVAGACDRVVPGCPACSTLLQHLLVEFRGVRRACAHGQRYLPRARVPAGRGGPCHHDGGPHRPPGPSRGDFVPPHCQ